MRHRLLTFVIWFVPFTPNLTYFDHTIERERVQIAQRIPGTKMTYVALSSCTCYITHVRVVFYITWVFTSQNFNLYTTISTCTSLFQLYRQTSIKFIMVIDQETLWPQCWVTKIKNISYCHSQVSMFDSIPRFYKPK